ncbi:hypothetical protein [Halobaculum lipolyticum]|uniref:Yip1 domain-containing protein n=1 Tax=Halobaculum lipolyticum TaxID=3032001 RepID=A0ABD5WBC3_9EURY|nr:hypothetical protein [Halobaculum sp. DT31]
MTGDDPIAAALLSESAYERVRYQRFGWFKQPVTRKLTLQSHLLHLLAGVLPVLALLPPDIRSAYFGGSVAAAAPKVGVVALVAVGVVAAAGVGLVGVGTIRLARGDDFDEHTAHSVLDFEDLCSMAGLATGGIATVATYAFVLMGFGGVETVRAWVAVGGGNPYAPTAVGPTVATVAVTALALGVCLRVAAAYLHACSIEAAGVDL